MDGWLDGRRDVTYIINNVDSVSQNLPIWVGNDTQKQIIFHSHFQILK